MTDLATLGLKIDSGPVNEATAGLERFQRSASDADRAAASFSRSGGGLSNTAKRLAADLDEAERSASSLGAHFARGFLVGAAVAGVAGLGAALKDAFDWATKTADQMKLLGMGARDFQGLQNAFAMGGVSNNAFNAGTTSLGSMANTEFREGEGKLTELLEANNLKITDREGRLKSVNDLLMDGARLVSEAGTEFDKIDIVRIMGLSKEWISILEQGPDALRKSIDAARESGNAIDEEMIQKAKQFEEWWSQSITNFGVWFKAKMAELVPYANHLGQIVANIMNPMATLERGARDMGDILSGRATVNRMVGPIDAPGPLVGLPQPADGLTIDMKPRRTTVIPTKSSGGGGGGGGGSASEEREDSFEREIRRMQERTKLIEEQTNVVGLGVYARERQMQVQRLLSAAEREGYEVATRYKDATDLLTGSTAGLSPVMAAQRDQILSVANAYAEAAAKADETRKQQAAIDDIRSFGGSVMKGFISDLRSGKSEAEAFRGALEKIGDKLADLAVDNLMSSLFGGKGGNSGGGGGLFSSIFSSIGSLFGGGQAVSGIYAKGGVFSHGDVTPFAKGGVVSGPTIFPFAKGTGLMGEAGPEAIMPLKRGPNGALGVAMHGGGGASISYNPTINVSGDASAESVAALRAELVASERRLLAAQQAGMKALVADEPKRAGRNQTRFG